MKGDVHKALHNQTGDTNTNWNKCKNKNERLRSQKKRGGPDAILDRSSSNTFLMLLSSQRPILPPRMKQGITNGYLFHHNATQTYANGTEVTYIENLEYNPTQANLRRNSASLTTRVSRAKVDVGDTRRDTKSLNGTDPKCEGALLKKRRLRSLIFNMNCGPRKKPPTKTLQSDGTSFIKTQ